LIKKIFAYVNDHLVVEIVNFKDAFNALEVLKQFLKQRSNKIMSLIKNVCALEKKFEI
jgi:hypothetical protein